MFIKIYRKIKKKYGQLVIPILIKNKTKFFCIGLNKTGTTSLKKAFNDLGFIVGSQRNAERLLPYYQKGDFDSITNYCHSAVVFQDFPFSFPETFKYMDKAFPHAKFILTIRDSPEQWYDSITNFHAKMFGKGKIPTKDDLQNASYVWKGWIWECGKLIYKTSEEDPYNKDILLKTYNDYNESVKNYFKNRPDDFIIINLSEKGGYQKLMKFLKINSPFNDFPWENKTELIEVK